MELLRFDDTTRERLLACTTFDEVILTVKRAGLELSDGEVADITIAVCDHARRREAPSRQSLLCGAV